MKVLSKDFKNIQDMIRNVLTCNLPSELKAFMPLISRDICFDICSANFVIIFSASPGDTEVIFTYNCDKSFNIYE